MENCLLLQRNKELKQQIAEFTETLDAQNVKLEYFEDLNVEEIKFIRADYQNME